MKPERRMRVLMIAYQCAPEGGSVAMIGWRWFRYMSELAEVHLVTHIRHREALTPHLPIGTEVSYIDTEWFAGPLFRLAHKLLGGSQHALFMVANLDFILFGYLVNRHMRRVHQQKPFDICHAPTPVAPVAPHRFGKIGPPTLVGPLNGGMPPLQGFPEISEREKTWLYPIRKLAKLATWLYGTFRLADIIFSATRQNDADLGPAYQHKIRQLCENGVDHVCETVPAGPPLPPQGPLRLVFVGRIIPVKGLRMLLDAMAEVARVELVLVGAGPEEAYLKQRVETLGLGERVHFAGFKPQAELVEYYRAAHLNVLPSVRESGGATILEAMAQGRPSIALNNGGPPEYITAETGFLIPCKHTEQVTRDLETLLQQLVAEPQRFAHMGEACLQHVRDTFTWPAKIQRGFEEYQRLIQQR